MPRAPCSSIYSRAAGRGPSVGREAVGAVTDKMTPSLKGLPEEEAGEDEAEEAGNQTGRGRVRHRPGALSSLTSTSGCESSKPCFQKLTASRHGHRPVPRCLEPGPDSGLTPTPRPFSAQHPGILMRLHQTLRPLAPHTPWLLISAE